MYSIIYVGGAGCNAAGENIMELIATLAIPVILLVLLFILRGNIFIGVTCVLTASILSPVVYDWGVHFGAIMIIIAIVAALKTLLEAFSDKGIPV